jgi:DNA-binding GntR family transcriptional regulator
MANAAQSTQLYDRLRAAILALDLAPGATLTERGLESLFDASRTPARAALTRLETEGLVQREGRGWIVAPIDLGEIQALAELREAIESAAVRLSIERASDQDIDDVSARLSTSRPAFDEEEGVRAGGDFHVQLAELSGNPFMVDAVRGAMTRLARTRWLEVRSPQSREKAWDEHAAILAAVRTRNPDLAATLIAEHIRGTNERLLSFLSAEHRRLRGSGLAIVSDGKPS